jgi:hypothetical protein
MLALKCTFWGVEIGLTRTSEITVLFVWVWDSSKLLTDLKFKMRLHKENDPNLLPGGGGHMVPVRSMIIKTS